MSGFSEKLLEAMQAEAAEADVRRDKIPCRWFRRKLRAAERMVLIAIVSHCNTSGEGKPGYSAIGRRAGIKDARTVSEVVSELKRRKFLAVHRRYDDTNRYVILRTDPSFWIPRFWLESDLTRQMKHLLCTLRYLDKKQIDPREMSLRKLRKMVGVRHETLKDLRDLKGTHWVESHLSPFWFIRA